MKKILLAVILTCLCQSAKAQNIFESTLLDKVMPVTQFKSAETRIALVDSVVRIGQYKGSSIVDLQVGFNGDTKPESNEVAGADLIVGAFANVSPYVKNYVNVPENWKFLNSIQFGPALFYDLRHETWSAFFQAGLAFSLRPK